MCSKQRKRRETIYWCSESEAELCLGGCFKSCHKYIFLTSLLFSRVYRMFSWKGELLKLQFLQLCGEKQIISYT
jgi:hypothetical protein